MHTHLPFQLSRNFCGVDNLQDQPLAVVGVAFDGATSYRSGSRLGPDSIRSASLMLTDGCHQDWPVQLNQSVGDAGNWPIPNGNSQAAVTAIERCHKQLIQRGHHLVCLGGDHLITLGILRSLTQQTGPLALLHFDAHCDTWSDHFGESIGHGTWLRNAIDEDLVDANHTISIGLRSPVDSATRHWLSDQGGTSISAHDAMQHSVATMCSKIRDKLGQHLPVYISLDIDCLDPAHAPGTGTPEIGGFSSMWLRALLDQLFVKGWKDTEWAGMDVVEVAPAYDVSEITSLAAATFVWQYLSMQSFVRKHKNA